MDIQLTVAGSTSVRHALKRFVTPEAMDGDNQWQCDDDGTKVDARKGLAFGSFPPLLTLHLKRFIFDWATERRLKLNDPVEIDATLNVAEYLSAEGAEVSAHDADRADFELFGILIHAGTAMGGHYYAYIKDLTTKLWHVFNDAEVSAVSDDDLAAMMDRSGEAAVVGGQEAPAPPLGDEPPSADGAAGALAGGLAMDGSGKWVCRHPCAPPCPTQSPRTMRLETSIPLFGSSNGKRQPFPGPNASYRAPEPTEP